MCIKDFVYRLSHDCHLDIDRDVSTVYCKSSSVAGGAIYTTVIVSDWCITDLAYCWWVSIQSIVGIIRGEDCSCIYYLFIYLTFLLDVTHYIIFTEAQRVKKLNDRCFRANDFKSENRN